MKKNNIFDINYLWLMFVLLHIAGASLVSIIDLLPLGSVLLLTSLAFLLYLCTKEWKYAITINAVFWCILLFVNQYIGAYFRPSYLLNMTKIVFLIYLAKNSRINLLEYCHIKIPGIKQVILTVLLAISSLLMAMYINCISMYFTPNHVVNSLQEASKNNWAGILTLAILPAIIEELMFRGCIYRAVPNKKMGILLSALCFALLHTNLNQMSYALFMGLCFGLVLYLTDNLSLTIGMHLIFNLYSILMTIWGNHPWVEKILHMHFKAYYLWNPTARPGQMKEVIFAGATVFLLAAAMSAFLFWLLRRDTKSSVGGKEESKADVHCKLDYRFFAACAFCLFIAYIYR